jgi:hypothetical protein
MHRTYVVQITEGKGTEFAWTGQALGDGHAVALAREAFERERERRPGSEVVSLEAVPS